MKKVLLVCLALTCLSFVGISQDADYGEIDVKAMKFGKAKPLPSEKIKRIEDELKTRLQKDQEVRKNPAKRGQMGSVDRDNTNWLKKTIKEIGWIDCERFSPQASSVAFLIVQHSGDLPLMKAALPFIEKDVTSKKFPSAQPYALLYDRLGMRLRGKQRYGTQISRTPEGFPMVLPLEDRDKVEQFRNEIGMRITLKRYLGFFAKQSGGIVWFAEDYNNYYEAEVSLRKKDFKKAEMIFLDIAEKMPRFCEVEYNLACLYALKGDKKKALTHLEKSIDKGFSKHKHMEKDSDLNSIRKTKKYAELLKRIKKSD